MRTRSQNWKKNDLSFSWYFRINTIFNRLFQPICIQFYSSPPKISKKTEKIEKMPKNGCFWPKNRQILIFFSKICLRKKIFFTNFLFSFAKFINKKNLKKNYFPLKTGRNRFFFRNGTVSSPLNPMNFRVKTKVLIGTNTKNTNTTGSLYLFCFCTTSWPSVLYKKYQKYKNEKICRRFGVK